jgi:hypothetical protein
VIGVISGIDLNVERFSFERWQSGLFVSRSRGRLVNNTKDLCAVTQLGYHNMVCNESMHCGNKWVCGRSAMTSPHLESAIKVLTQSRMQNTRGPQQTQCLRMNMLRYAVCVNRFYYSFM